MPDSTDTLVVNAHVEVPVSVLTAVKEYWKKAPESSRAHDPAEELNRFLSRFVMDKDFLSFIQNLENTK